MGVAVMAQPWEIPEVTVMAQQVPGLSIEIESSSEGEDEALDEPLMPLRPSPPSRGSNPRASPLGPSPRPSPLQRRGSVVQLTSSGSETPRRSAALSLKGELHAALARLREAKSSDDVRWHCSPVPLPHPH